MLKDIVNGNNLDKAVANALVLVMTDMNIKVPVKATTQEIQQYSDIYFDTSDTAANINSQPIYT